MVKLLFIEDEAGMLYIMQNGLETVIGGYEVITARNGQEGLVKWREHRPDIIVSDIEMPVMDGFDMVAEIRRTDAVTPIIFASGLISPQDVMKGYQIGINNYIKKPYIVEELDAHVKALLKMTRGERLKDASETYGIGRYRFDGIRSELSYPDGSVHPLSPKESQILQVLCKNMNETVRRESILEMFWPEADYFTSRSLDVFVTKLRRRFTMDDHVQILTMKGVGLKLLVDR